MTKLTEELLLSLGFAPANLPTHRGGGRVFRYTVPVHRRQGYYAWQIQVQISDYIQLNPNAGIVSVYSPSESITSEGEVFDLPERETPVAWYVVTLERLNAIYAALTEHEPFKSTIK